MRVIMGVLKSKGGVYYVRKKVPAKLEQAVSTVLGAFRPRVSWLKKSLRTKDPRQANIKAKPVLIEFDGVLASAESPLQDATLQTHLSEREIEPMATYQFASMLQEDEEVRRDGTGSEELFEAFAGQTSQFALNGKPAFGLSDREMVKMKESVGRPPSVGEGGSREGNISFVGEELAELLDAFRVNLHRDSRSYRQLGMAVLDAVMGPAPQLKGKVAVSR